MLPSSVVVMEMLLQSLAMEIRSIHNYKTTSILYCTFDLILCTLYRVFGAHSGIMGDGAILAVTRSSKGRTALERQED